jgi:hypothetical protein
MVESGSQTHDFRSFNFEQLLVSTHRPPTIEMHILYMHHRPAHVGCGEIFLDVPVHTLPSN